MTSQYRHRRTSNPATAFPNPLEPGEIAVNTANRQLAVGDAQSGVIGAPLTLIAVRYFDPRAQYAAGDLVVQGGVIYQAKASISPGAFNASQWTAISGDPTTFVLKAGDVMTGNLNIAMVHPGLLLSGSASGSTAYINGSIANKTRWTLFLTDGVAESGGNAGSHLRIRRYDDAGAFLSDPLLINRADGLLYVAGDPTGALGVATKQYVDAGVTGLQSGKVAKAGDTMAGSLTTKVQTGPITGSDYSLMLQTAASSPGDAPYMTFHRPGIVLQNFGLDTDNLLKIVQGGIAYKLFHENYSPVVRTDAAQSLTATQQEQSRKNVYAAPLDALAYNGMQINGAMDVSQERGTAGVASSPTPQHVVDGWLTVQQSSGAGWAAAQANIGNVLGVQNAIYIGTNAAATFGANDYAQLYQYIEGWRVARLAWGTANAQPITIGFWIYSGAVAGTMCVTVRNSAGNRSYVSNVTINAAGTWEYKTITVPGDTAGTWLKDSGVGMVLIFAFAIGTTYRTTAGVWTAGLFSGSPQISNLFAAATTNYLTGVVVLPGNEAPSAVRSPFIMRPYGQELALCERYLEVWHASPAGAYSIAALGGFPTATQMQGWMPFRTRKRVVPTVSYSALADFLVLWQGLGALSPALSAITSQYTSQDQLGVLVTAPGATFTPGGVGSLSAATGNAKLIADARL